MKIAGAAKLTMLALACNPKMTSRSADAPAEVTFYITSDYCGGANPGEEVIAALKEPKVLKNANVFLKKNGASQPLKIATNENGVALLDLKKGEYSFYFEEKMAFKAAEGNEACAGWKSTPDGTLTLQGNEGEAKITMRKTCNPCVPSPY